LGQVRKEEERVGKRKTQWDGGRSKKNKGRKVEREVKRGNAKGEIFGRSARGGKWVWKKR